MIPQQEFDDFIKWIDGLPIEEKGVVREAFLALIRTDAEQIAAQHESTKIQKEHLEKLRSTITRADETQLETIRKKLSSSK